jgi:hypothetical protein
MAPIEHTAPAAAQAAAAGRVLKTVMPKNHPLQLQTSSNSTRITTVFIGCSPSFLLLFPVGFLCAVPFINNRALPALPCNIKNSTVGGWFSLESWAGVWLKTGLLVSAGKKLSGE